jgi:hypothetical protein
MNRLVRDLTANIGKEVELVIRDGSHHGRGTRRSPHAHDPQLRGPRH